MLFGYKKCQKCESEYDVASPTCPMCGAPEKGYEKRKISPSIIWLDTWKQAVIFVIGWAGLSIAATFASIIFGKTSYDSLTINFFAYFTVLTFIGLLMSNNLRRIWPHFKNAYPYVVGLLGCLVLYLFSTLYGNLINMIHPIEVSTNEQTADSFIVSFPVVAFMVIVIMGPVCEELTYRVGFFSLLYRVKPWIAYLASIILFGFIHFNFQSMGNGDLFVNEMLNLPFYLFAGFLFCFLYHKWGLAASLSAHLLNNLLTFLLVLAGSQL